jgi:argininosuccinate lyase
MQRAQPVSIGAYLLSFVEQLARDNTRLTNCSDLLNVSPLGSGAVAGSTLPLDRKNTAKQLGFAGITWNSIDAVSDRDFCAEFIFVCSLIAAHLSKLAEDWIIYTSIEFSFIKTDDKYCTSSSMMPQKRNPDMLELIRGKTGSVYGSLVAMLTILKAQPSTYNRDLQEDKIHIFNAADTVGMSLDMSAAIVNNTKFNAKHIAAGLDKGFLEATAFTEYLVKKGVPFREAHGIVGGLVAHCEDNNCKLSDLTIDRFKQDCEKIEADVHNTLSPAGVMKQYLTEGSGAPAQVEKQVQYWKNQLKEQ